MLRNIREAQKNEEGFTLIELLVVVIIIGILAAIAIPSFLNQRERAWQSELTSTVRNVALEIEAEATKTGGNYSSSFADAAALNTFVDTQLNALQGDPASPVAVVDAETTVAPNSFLVCMEHDSFTGSVTYDSDGGGLQDFSSNACTVAPAP